MIFFFFAFYWMTKVFDHLQYQPVWIPLSQTC